MARAIEEGARGIEPGSGTAVVPPMGAAATTVLATEQRTRVSSVTPRQPRAGQPRHEHEQEKPGPKPRTARIAAAIGVVAAVVIVLVVIVLSAQSSSSVQLQHGPFVSSFDGVFRQLTTLIGENTS